MANLDQAAKPLSTVRLHIAAGPHQGESRSFDSHQTWTVGRSASAHLQLPEDPRCSRFHCRFEMSPPECVVIDLNSTNGTYVNGERIKEPRVLADQDKIDIGNTELRVHIDNTELAPSPAAALQETLALSKSQCLPELPGYELDRYLGMGGMGLVYHGRQRGTQREVAVKFLKVEAQASDINLNSFLREISISIRLKHLNIVETLEFGMLGALPFMVMEYVPQIALNDVLQKTSPSGQLRISSAVISRVLDALQYAHERNIVHRDIKPTNLLVYKQGGKLQVKLADFGLAKDFANAGLSALSVSSEFKGTLGYMPPEQILDCRYAKPACDIYGAGACLYTLIAGRPPYQFSDVSEGLAKILNEPPEPLRSLCPATPPALIQVVERAMAREPKSRYQSARQMHHDLLTYCLRSTYVPDK